MKKIQFIHFVGIKGVGMTPLAIIAKEAGLKVSGCDIGEKFITDEALKRSYIAPLVGFSPSHLTSGNSKVDMVITTGAHGGFDNPEVVSAREKNISVLTHGQAVGEFMKGEILGRHNLIGISVTGTHGKTTTTAMLATVLKEAGMDPSYVIGTGIVPSLGGNGHYGRGKYFVAEADEYATEPTYDKTAKFLWQHPKIAIITNIELDHTDLYPTIADVRNAFITFARQLPNDGVLVINGDDSQCEKLLKEYNGRRITFGRGDKNDFILKRVSISAEQTFFWLDSHNTSLGEFAISIPGEHNALNATSVIIAALECALSLNAIKRALALYSGSKRRFEYVGKLASGALLYDDYAHHPTEIKKTLESFRKRFPKHKIVCIFQPHTYSRTKSMFEDFIHSFSLCNTVIITNIYPSLREKPDLAVSSQRLFESMSRFHPGVIFLPQLRDVVEYVNQKQHGGDTIVVTMGAGDVYKINEKLKMKDEK